MRRKLLRISPDLMAHFLMRLIPPGIQVDGMPPDARIVGASWDYYRDAVLLTVESDSFEFAPDSENLPYLDVSFTRDTQGGPRS